MADDPLRSIELTRRDRLRMRAHNIRGGTLDFGDAAAGEFNPIELLLIGIAGCTAMDVDAITSKRSEPEHFNVSLTSNKVRDEQGNHLVDLTVHFDVAFPDTEEGRAAEAVLETAIRRSHDVLCTVSRTVQLGTPIAVTLRGEPLTFDEH